MAFITIQPEKKLLISFEKVYNATISLVGYSIFNPFLS